MKKLLILMLVLGLASVANAVCDSLQISVNGEKNPVNSQINVMPSDHLVLDIWTNADIVAGTGEGWWAMTCKTQDGVISGGVTLWEGDAAIYPDPAGAGVILPAGENGVFGQQGLAVVSKIPAGSTVYDQIDFHCERMNDVVVTLWLINDDLTVTPQDSVIIHQIPEPATMLLLGLGGLLLRRRK